MVQRLVHGLEGRGHCLVVDNLFASVNLFHDLMVKGIWATGTVKRRSKNLPAGLYRKCEDKDERGSMLIRTHVHRQMGVLSWQDSKLVTILSTAASPWAPNVFVLRREKGRREQLIVPSSPMHTQYVEYMRGVDVTDQLRGSYSSQLRCHKWWLKIFHFIVDQSLVNAYVTWVREMQDMGLTAKPHLAFKISVGKHLVEGAIRPGAKSEPLPLEDTDDHLPHMLTSHPISRGTALSVDMSSVGTALHVARSGCAVKTATCTTTRPWIQLSDCISPSLFHHARSRHAIYKGDAIKVAVCSSRP